MVWFRMHAEQGQTSEEHHAQQPKWLFESLSSQVLAIFAHLHLQVQQAATDAAASWFGVLSNMPGGHGEIPPLCTNRVIACLLPGPMPQSWHTALMTPGSSMLCLHVIMVAIHIIHELTEPGLHVGWHRSSPHALWQPCTVAWLTWLGQDTYPGNSDVAESETLRQGN